MSNNNKSRSRLSAWIRRMLGMNKKELSFAEEEALQSPIRMIGQKFFSNRLSRFGLILFIIIFLVVMIGPKFMPVILSYQDNTQANVPPGMNMLSVPKELRSNLLKIVPGLRNGLGISKDGKVYMWGYTKLSAELDLAKMPEEMKNAKIVDAAIGYDHAVAIDENGKLYTWGNDRLGQNKYPKELADAMKENKNLDIVHLAAGNQFSVAIDKDGRLYVWGNENLNDIKIKKAFKDARFSSVSTNINNFITLSSDGAVVYPARQKNAYSAIPEGLDKDVELVASTSFTNAAVKKDGSIVVWGNATKGEDKPPKIDEKIVKLVGGRYHYTALGESGKVYSWGDNFHGQSQVPTAMSNKKIVDVFAGFYQNYALSEDGQIFTWGLRGYLLGTDEFGRSIANRILNGGKVTMTVGAVSVVISLVIGVLLGGIAGYFGGKIDMIVMRLAEIVGGLPFLPFALILSAILGSQISVEQRMYLIMVVLGVLSWTPLCRLVRAQIFAQREMEFVTAAKAMGVKESAIVFKHIIPNVISVILVSATLSFATCMLTESTLSYLGFGIAPPTPTWGNMLMGANNSIVIQQYWWRWVFPAIIFSLCTICINLIGDGLRDAIDPKSNER